MEKIIVYIFEAEKKDSWILGEYANELEAGSELYSEISSNENYCGYIVKKIGGEKYYLDYDLKLVSDLFTWFRSDLFVE